MRLSQIARLFAPILWLAPNESTSNFLLPLPVPIEHGVEGDRFVYWQLLNIGYRAAPPASGASEPEAVIDLAAVNSLTISYFFYFPRETGVGQHPYDLERADVRLSISHLKPSASRGVSATRQECAQILLDRVDGLAHGIRLLTNSVNVEHDVGTLNLGVLNTFTDVPERRLLTAVMMQVLGQRPFALPPTLLVEENKHAIAPDRNGDGVFTPGYDVNRFRNDAWGLRDNFGASYVGTKFDASMAKQRRVGHRIFPEVSGLGSAAESVRADYACVTGLTWDRGDATYTLRPSPTNGCEIPQSYPLSVRNDAEANRFRKRCTNSKFGAAPIAHGGVSSAFQWPLGRESVGVGIRASEHAVSPAFYLAGLGDPWGGGWVGLRALSNSLSVFYAPSGSRWIDWYLVPLSTRRPILMTEIGVKLRVPLRNVLLDAPRALEVVGLRLGAEFTDHKVVGARTPRLILEVGIGPW